MRVILDVKDSEWGFLLSLLKRFEFVRVQPTDEVEQVNSNNTTPTFKAIELNTTGFSFNREEANER